MVSKFFINVEPEEIVSDLKKLRIDMMEYEKLGVKPHPNVMCMKLSRILEKMGIRADDNEV